MREVSWCTTPKSFPKNYKLAHQKCKSPSYSTPVSSKNYCLKLLSYGIWLKKPKVPCHVLVVKFLLFGWSIPVFAHFSIGVNIFLIDFYIKDINLPYFCKYFPVIFIVFLTSVLFRTQQLFFQKHKGRASCSKPICHHPGFQSSPGSRGCGLSSFFISVIHAAKCTVWTLCYQLPQLKSKESDIEHSTAGLEKTRECWQV